MRQRAVVGVILETVLLLTIGQVLPMTLLVTYLGFQRSQIGGILGENHLPRVLIVVSGYPPYCCYGARPIVVDLLEYGIVPNVTGTSIYVNMNREKYDIIVFAGHSNPVDPDVIVKSALADIAEGKKIVILGSAIFERRGPSEEIVNKHYAFGEILGIPSEQLRSGSIEGSLSSTDDLFKSYPPESYSASLSSRSRYFAVRPNGTIAYVDDSNPGHHYYLLMTSRGAWISTDIIEYLHFGKVVAKLWFGNSPFGFSLDRSAGLPNIVWRVDADYSNDAQALEWLNQLARNYTVRMTLGAVGGKIDDEAAAILEKPCR